MTSQQQASSSSTGKKILIFLDIDGVLLPFPASQHKSSSSCGAFFPDNTLAALSEILQVFPASIILSSTWRSQTAAIAEIINSFQCYGQKFGGPLKGYTELAGMTDPDWHTERQHEIANYLLNTTDDTTKVAAWLALDDEELLEGTENQKYHSYFVDRVVKTNSRCGLTQQDARTAIQLLNKQLVGKGGKLY